MVKDTKYIKIMDGGPYLVFGKPNIIEEIMIPDEDGAPCEYQNVKKFASDKEPVALCRCGHSKNKPYCDGMHTKIEWDDKETASFEPIIKGAETFEGPNLKLLDNEDYCSYARFCDAKGRIWNLVMEGTLEADKQAIKEACNCPAGRLMMYDKKTGKAIEPNLEPSISVLEDPEIGVSGPLWVKGGIKVLSSDGKEYEARNRQTLCRCGASGNKPFCDGSHASINFEDGLVTKPVADR